MQGSYAKVLPTKFDDVSKTKERTIRDEDERRTRRYHAVLSANTNLALVSEMKYA